MIEYQKLAGWFDYEDIYDEWAGRCPEYGDVIIIELGVFCGRSLGYLANKLIELGKTHVKLVGIDYFSNSVTEEMLVRNNESLLYRGKPKKVLKNYSKRAVEKNLSEYPNLTIIKGNTYEEVVKIPADFIWIDADHTYEGVKKDLEAARQSLKYGGVIGGHDYGVLVEVTQAFDEFIANRYVENVKVGKGSLGLGNIQFNLDTI